MAVTTTTTRHSFNGSGSAYSSGGTPVGQGPFSINFTVIDATHIDVYWTKASSGAGTPTSLSVSGNLTINTHYTIQNAGTGSTATITWVESGFTADSTVTFPTSSDLIVITRNVPLTQVTNYQNNATIDAETIEASFDKLAQTAQQLSDDKDYSFKFASNLSGATGFDSTADTASTITLGKTARANKVLGFNADGDALATQEIGSFLGNWAASTAYVARDIVKDSSNSNIYICNTSHTSTGSTPVSTNTDVAKWTLIVDAASTTTSTTTASEWASKTSGIVVSTDYSAKAYAIGGTGVTTSSGKGAAKEWATTTGGAVDTSEYSAKEYSVGTTATSSKSYALKVDGAVTGTDFSSKAWAVGGTNVTTTSSRGAAKEWATSTGAAVDTSEYSAKEYAIGDVTASGGSAKAWAIDGSSPDDSGEKSAKTLAGESATSATASATSATASATSATASATSATASATSATASAASATSSSASEVAAKNSAAAVSAVYEGFADTYLGQMANGASASSGSANGTWAKNSSSITLASTSGTIEAGQEVTGTGIPADANILSVDGSTIVISENMAALGSGVSLTFTGQGIYGAYSVGKDGPALDNDGDALATGALYFNTTDNGMKVYDGAAFIAASSAGTTSLVIHKFTASGSETSVASASFSPALSYTANSIIVFLNGVSLDSTDYTASNGTTITGLSALAASDELVVCAFKSFTVADTVSAASGGTFNGDVSMGTDNKLLQKGAFMQSSTHQAWVLGG